MQRNTHGHPVHICKSCVTSKTRKELSRSLLSLYFALLSLGTCKTAYSPLGGAPSLIHRQRWGACDSTQLGSANMYHVAKPSCKPSITSACGCFFGPEHFFFFRRTKRGEIQLIQGTSRHLPISRCASVLRITEPFHRPPARSFAM